MLGKKILNVANIVKIKTRKKSKDLDPQIINVRVFFPLLENQINLFMLYYNLNINHKIKYNFSNNLCVLIPFVSSLFSQTIRMVN